MNVIFKYDPENEQDRKWAGMQIKFYYTYNMAPELKDEFDEFQFESKEIVVKPRKYDSD